jgi:hypothetical protein
VLDFVKSLLLNFQFLRWKAGRYFWHHKQPTSPSNAMRPLLPLLLVTLCLLTACEKDDPEPSLPAASAQGLNTGGFLLNGISYPATGWSGSFMSMAGDIAALTGGYQVSFPGYETRPDYSLSIHSERAGKRVTVTLFLRKPQVGELSLNRDTGLPPMARDSTVFDHATVYISDGSGEMYSTSSRHTGRVNMSLHMPAAKISAGTFEFTAVSTVDPNKTVRVSAGRFDRKQ